MATGSGPTPPRPSLQARLERRFVRKPPTPLRAAVYIAGFTLAVAILAGLIAHWIDDGIPSIWLGVYWAVQTVTTVGYGNPTPTGTSGQVLAVMLMLLGTAFVAVITAAVTSVFIERARTIRESGAEDSDDATLEEIRESLARIEARLEGWPSNGTG
jgi:voltage-gated potassium channel